MKVWQRWSALLLMLGMSSVPLNCARRSGQPVTGKNEAQYRRLLEAIQDNDVTEARRLIAAGYGWRPLLDPKEELHLPDGRYFFAAHLASRNLREGILQHLLRTGVDPDVRDERGRTPLMWLCTGTEFSDAQLRCLHLLVDAGGDVNAKNAWYGETALHYAARYQGPPIVRELLALNANVHARTAAGDTPLHEACARLIRKEQLAVVQLLVNAGANPNAKNHKGQSPRDLLGDDVFSRILINRNNAETQGSKK